MVTSIPTPESYPDLPATLQARTRDARLLFRQSAQGWGTGVIDRLARDLNRDFPDMTGLSPRNLIDMRALAEAWPDRAIVQQLVAQLPWGHNIRLLEALNLPEERAWYARQAIENGWSRAELVHQIEVRPIERAGKARTLPSPQSDLTRGLLKDPFDLEVLAAGADISERALERGLLDNLRALLLELGKGFAFVGSQYHIAIGDQPWTQARASSTRSGGCRRIHERRG